MNAPLGLLASLLLTASFAIALGALIAASLRSLPDRSGWAPATRADGSLALLLLPPALGLIGCCAVLAPGLLHFLGAAADHCFAHLHHGHVCAVHSPLVAGGTAERLVLLSSGLFFGSCAARGTWRVVVTQRIAHRLTHIAVTTRLAETTGNACGGRQPACLLLPTHSPLAFTVGVLAPRTFLSTGLMQALDAASLAAIVAHEEAHRRRRDGLRQLFAGMARPFHLPATARALHDAMARSTEEACDEQAAHSTGARQDVARALIRCSRLMTVDSPAPALPASMATAGHYGATGALCERVERLLRPTAGAGEAAPARMLLPLLGIGSALTSLALGSHPGVHHTVEAVLAVLAS